MSCGQGIFKLDGSFQMLTGTDGDTPSTKVDTSPMNLQRTKSQEAREKALLELIDQEMGAGSCRETVFDVQRLEIQALKYLQLEETLATNNKQVRLQIQFKTVVASCCYLQYKQAENDEIDVQEVFKMCKILGVKPGKALDFLNKWSMKLDQGKFDETFDIVRFSKEVKKK